MKTIDQAKFEKETSVFLRADFNVPIKSGKISDDNRILAVLPTINYLLDKGASITIGSHLGKPEGKPNPEFSLFPIANKLSELLNLDAKFNQPSDKYLLGNQIILLENLRFNPGEESNDDQFAKELALGKDIYINDAFAVSHRSNASVEAITKYLPSYAGLLMQKEVEELTKIKDHPTSPFILIIGGVKIEDKAGVIEFLAPKVSKILLGGGVANTFLKASGQDIGDSVYDKDMVEKCKQMLEKYGDKIELPIDTVKDRNKILDIGSQTIEKYLGSIKDARTVFWNGNLGYTEEGKYKVGSRAIAEALNSIDGTTVLAGGDTVGFFKSEGLDKNITFISTGGGAALEFLAGKELPGIIALQ